MALTDPQNVQLGQQRRAALLARLATQMRMKAGSQGRALGGAGRVQSTGRSFGNSVDLRAGAAPKFTLPFALPDGRVRPAGFEDNPGQGPPSYAPAVGAGGGTSPASASGAPDPSSGLPQMDPSVPGGFPVDPSGFNSDTPLEAPSASAAPVTNYGTGPYIGTMTPAQLAAMGNNATTQAPDPYSVMMQRMNMLRQQRMDAMGIGA